MLMTMVQASPAGQPSGTAGFLFQTFPFIIIFLIFYLLWIRPQNRRLKEHRERIAAVRKGDEVVTAGGIRARVTKVSDDEVEVEIANGVKVRIVKSTLTHVVSSGSGKPAND
jgi:preprotein translocase subunit YajC